MKKIFLSASAVILVIVCFQMPAQAQMLKKPKDRFNDKFK
jgi:hypothetical protein